MRVTRLEIFGFKSFLERIVLPLEGGVTGVVGPNGCGKSNIVDAIRWVLGETRARTLRGDVLEDIIFNGTDKLRPLGLAEVTMTLRASSGDFFSDLVANSFNAEGLADSILGAQPLVVEDEHPLTEEQLQHEAPSSPPKLTVIEGRLGRKEEDLQKDPENHGSHEQNNQDSAPIVSEQAVSSQAGVVKTKQKDGEPTPFLTRFAWLKSVNEVQVTRRLYRSGESEFFINRVPCRLKDMKELFRAAGIGPKAYTIVAQGEVSRIVTARPEERRLILEEAAGVLGLRDKIAAAQRRLEETSANLARVDDVIKEVSRQVQSLKRQASRAKNRKELKDQIATLEQKISAERFLDLQHRRSELTEEDGQGLDGEHQAEANLHKHQALELEARNSLMSMDVEGDDIRSQIDSIKEEINTRLQSEGERRSRLSELRAFVTSARTEIEKLVEHRVVLQARSQEYRDSIAALEQRSQEMLRSEVGISASSADRELAESGQSLNDRRGQLRLCEQAVAEAREQVAGLDSARAVIEQQLHQESSPAILDSLNAGVSAEKLIEGLTVPAHLAGAVQAVLGDRGQFAVVDRPHAIADQIASRLGKNSIGLVQAGSATSGEALVKRLPDMPLLLDQIEVSPNCQHAAWMIFKNVYLATSLEEAILTISNHGQFAPDVILVTVAGDVVTATGYARSSSEGGALVLRHRLTELEAKRQDFAATLSCAAAARDNILAEVEQLEQRQRELLRLSQESVAQSRQINSEHGAITGRLEAERRLLAQIEQDLAHSRDGEDKLIKNIEGWTADQARVEQSMSSGEDFDETELQGQIKGFQARLSEINEVRSQDRQRLAELSQAVEQARQALDAIRANRSHVSLELQKISLEEDNLVHRITDEYGPEFLDSCREFAKSAERLESIALAEAVDEVGKLKARVIREGDVDSTSIERFEEENTRLEDLTVQRKDLDDAGHTLLRTIEKLTETSEKRFVETFNAVRENFSRLVPRLFGGGRATLELLDPAHPLESGVEIVARPPGKKLKSIDLMSGGEKALCATALIFSMFLERPSPLCVLDEVDAPLDDANLLRFLNMIQEMSTRTQFLIITHNKQSMALANHLVGVTMQEPGASNIITVSLQEAFTQVA